MNVIFFGSPEAAIPPFLALRASRHWLLAAVTQPDRPAGRGHAVQPTAVKDAALEAGVPVLQPPSLKDPDFPGILGAMQPDLFVVVAYGRILPQALLDVPRLGSLNVHFSLLPRYRGAAPVQWALLNGERETGVSIMQMDVGLDTGGVLAQEAILIEETDDVVSIESRLARIGADLLLKTLDLVDAGKAIVTPQDNNHATHARAIRKEDGRIDWTESAPRVCRTLRALKRWPGAYFLLRETSVRVLDGVPVSLPSSSTQISVPGEILEISREGILVACGQGDAYLVKQVQPAGGGSMDGRSFANGYRLACGDLLL